MSAATFWGDRVVKHLNDMHHWDSEGFHGIADELAETAAKCATFAGTAARVQMAPQPQGFICQWCDAETLSVSSAGLCGRCDADTTLCDRCQVRLPILDAGLTYDRAQRAYVPLCDSCIAPGDASDDL
jgi:hypothetical protein